MPRANGAKTEAAQPETAHLETAPEVSEQPLPTALDLEDEVELEEPSEPETIATHDLDDILNALKTLLSTVEKLQKIRHEVGDVKPLILRMLDGAIVAGEELEQLKTGVGGLSRLIRAYSDHQTALSKAQPARSLLDEVLK